MSLQEEADWLISDSEGERELPPPPLIQRPKDHAADTIITSLGPSLAYNEDSTISSFTVPPPNKSLPASDISAFTPTVHASSSVSVAASAEPSALVHKPLKPRPVPRFAQRATPAPATGAADSIVTPTNGVPSSVATNANHFNAHTSSVVEGWTTPRDIPELDIHMYTPSIAERAKARTLSRKAISPPSASISQLATSRTTTVIDETVIIDSDDDYAAPPIRVKPKPTISKSSKAKAVFEVPSSDDDYSNAMSKKKKRKATSKSNPVPPSSSSILPPSTIPTGPATSSPPPSIAGPSKSRRKTTRFSDSMDEDNDDAVPPPPAPHRPAFFVDSSSVEVRPATITPTADPVLPSIAAEPKIPQKKRERKPKEKKDKSKDPSRKKGSKKGGDSTVLDKDADGSAQFKSKEFVDTDDDADDDLLLKPSAPPRSAGPSAVPAAALAAAPSLPLLPLVSAVSALGRPLSPLSDEESEVAVVIQRPRTGKEKKRKAVDDADAFEAGSPPSKQKRGNKSKGKSPQKKPPSSVTSLSPSKRKLKARGHVILDDGDDDEPGESVREVPQDDSVDTGLIDHSIGVNMHEEKENLEPSTAKATPVRTRAEPPPKAKPQTTNPAAPASDANADGKPKKRTLADMIRTVESRPNSPFHSPRASPHYSAFNKTSRKSLSRIASLHPNRRTPPPPPPRPPPPKKTRKELEREEKWEEELQESVEGWAVLTEEERAVYRRAKRDQELGYD